MFNRQEAVYYFNAYCKDAKKEASNATLLVYLKCSYATVNINSYADFCDLATALADEHDAISSPPCSKLKFAVIMSEMDPSQYRGQVPELPMDVNHMRFLAAKFSRAVGRRHDGKVQELASRLNIKEKKAFKLFCRQSINNQEFYSIIAENYFIRYIKSYDELKQLADLLHVNGYPLITNPPCTLQEFVRLTYKMCEPEHRQYFNCKINIPSEQRHAVFIEEFKAWYQRYLTPGDPQRYMRFRVLERNNNEALKDFLAICSEELSLISSYEDLQVVVAKIIATQAFPTLTNPACAPDEFAARIHNARENSSIAMRAEVSQNMDMLEVLAEYFHLLRNKRYNDLSYGHTTRAFILFLMKGGVISHIDSYAGLCSLVEKIRSLGYMDLKKEQIPEDFFIDCHLRFNTSKHFPVLDDDAVAEVMLTHYKSCDYWGYDNASVRQFLEKDAKCEFRTYASYEKFIVLVENLPGSQVNDNLFASKAHFVEFAMGFSTCSKIAFSEEELLVAGVAAFDAWKTRDLARPVECRMTFETDNDRLMRFLSAKYSGVGFKYTRTYEAVCHFAEKLALAGFEVSSPPFSKHRYNIILRSEMYGSYIPHGAQFALESLSEQAANKVYGHRDFFAEKNADLLRRIAPAMPGERYLADVCRS